MNIKTTNQAICYRLYFFIIALKQSREPITLVGGQLLCFLRSMEMKDYSLSLNLRYSWPAYLSATRLISSQALHNLKKSMMLSMAHISPKINSMVLTPKEATNKSSIINGINEFVQRYTFQSMRAQYNLMFSNTMR